MRQKAGEEPGNEAMYTVGYSHDIVCSVSVIVCAALVCSCVCAVVYVGMCVYNIGPRELEK